MDKTKAVWFAISGDAVNCCNEDIHKSVNVESDIVSPSLFETIIEKIQEHGWDCTILVGKKAIPEDYQEILTQMNVDYVIPSGHEGEIHSSNVAITFESEDCECYQEFPTEYTSILRVTRCDLNRLSGLIKPLLARFRDVTVRHPELLQYTEADIDTYSKQLLQVGEYMLEECYSFDDYRVSCLTDRYFSDKTRECGAGAEKIAVDYKGYLYTCPAAMGGTLPNWGHITDEIKLPNRHLFTRNYALPCSVACQALHCGRCVYFNKQTTNEVNVPPKLLCQLAHAEVRVQAILAQKAKNVGMWKPSWYEPEMSEVDDPYVKVKRDYEEDGTYGDAWLRLLKLSGRPQDMTPSNYLDIIHQISARVNTVVRCMEAGYVPSYDLIVSDPLVSLRFQTIERYRNISLGDDLGSVHEIEQSIHKMAEKRAEILCAT